MLSQILSAAAKPAAVLAVIVAALAGSVIGADAGSSVAPAMLRSKGPCSFSQQLQSSVSQRKEYLTKLARVLGDAVAETNPVEEMYGNIETASFRESAEDSPDSRLNIWGFETKRTVVAAGIDTFSTDCLACHDGNAALLVSATNRNDPFAHGSRRSPAGDHPIGMEYERYVGAGNRYKSILGSSNKMVFVDGKVGCLTCHDPMNPEMGHLVMSDRNSALCLTCHNK